MNSLESPIPSAWVQPPSAKAKNAVQRSVTALLDELAPERVVKRTEQIVGPVEQNRTPNGCVLQASTAAISLSWFAAASTEAVLGELHILVWRGSVTQRGVNQSRRGATMVEEMVVRPIEPPADGFVWKAIDGTLYNTATLATKCLAMLAAQEVRG